MLPVVICGAGPVGLVLALELAQWQVPVLIVERHRQPSPFPRGRAISTRSMEIVRYLGMERKLTAMALSRIETAYFFADPSLLAPDFGRIGTGPANDGAEVSPTAALGCPQDRFESLLRQRATDHPLARCAAAPLSTQPRTMIAESEA